MAWLYEIRGSNNALLKRDGGFAMQDAAKIAGRVGAKKVKNASQPSGSSVGTMMGSARMLRSPQESRDG